MADDAPPPVTVVPFEQGAGAAPGEPIRQVLVVDDDPGVLSAAVRVVAFALRNAGAPPVHAASSTTEALAVLDAHADDEGPWLLITDFNLACDLDGLELIGVVKENGHDVRSVLMSGYAQSDFADRLDASGVAAFVTKPWRTKEFAGLVRDLAKGGDKP